MKSDTPYGPSALLPIAGPLQWPSPCIQRPTERVQCTVMVHGGTWRQDDAVLDRNWRLACRVATASGGLAAALAAALYLFAGVSAGFLVVATAVVALVIGLRLPPASPKLALQRVRERLVV